MYRFFIIVFFCTGLFLKCDANTPSAKPVVQQMDSSKIHSRKFDAAALKSYNKDPEFKYTEHDIEESWWDNVWAWLWNIIEKLFGGKRTVNAPSSPFIKYLVMAVIIGLLIYFGIKILGVDGIFRREPEQIEVPYTETLENIHEIAFNEEIEKAISLRNYRLAVRLLYLHSLKQMNDAQLINWQIEKTNSAYLNELTNSTQKQSFSILTKQFEYVWYGNFPVDTTSFQHINGLFIDFKKMLS